jgi:hypothetical protein
MPQSLQVGARRHPKERSRCTPRACCDSSRAQRGCASGSERFDVKLMNSCGVWGVGDDLDYGARGFRASRAVCLTPVAELRAGPACRPHRGTLVAATDECLGGSDVQPA